MNNKQIDYFYNFRKEAMSRFEENYNIKVSFLFMSSLIAINCFPFNTSNKTNHVPT